jgi:hypothetical protein
VWQELTAAAADLCYLSRILFRGAFASAQRYSIAGALLDVAGFGQTLPLWFVIRCEPKPEKSKTACDD